MPSISDRLHAMTITPKVRYDGYQECLIGPGCWCYTITDEKSPAHGASLSIDAEQPTPEIIAAAVSAKEAEFSKALQETTPYP